MNHARTDRKPAHHTPRSGARRAPWQRPRREAVSENMTVAQIARNVPPHFSLSRVSGVLATLGLRSIPRLPPELFADAVVTAPRTSDKESFVPFCGKP